MLKFSPIMLFNMLKLRPKFAYYKRYLLLLNAFWYHYSQNHAEINHRYTKPKQNCVVMCRQWESIANYNTPNPTKQAITRCLFCAIAKLFFISISFFFLDRQFAVWCVLSTVVGTLWHQTAIQSCSRCWGRGTSPSRKVVGPKPDKPDSCYGTAIHACRFLQNNAVTHWAVASRGKRKTLVAKTTPRSTSQGANIVTSFELLCWAKQRTCKYTHPHRNM